MSTAIVTDSTCDLPGELVDQHAIEVVPMHILWGTESYKDGLEMPSNEFYRRLGTAPTLPKTSQPSPEEFANAYGRARETQNADNVLCVTVSHALSGTYNSAVAACNMVDFPVQVVDSLTVSMALGYSVLEAVDARDRGASLDEMIEAAMHPVKHGGLLFAVDTLEFLHRGGRIGGAKRLFGTVLSIKPILEIREGHVEPAENVRTRKRALSRLIEIVAERAERPVQIGILQGQAQQDAEFLYEEVIAKLNPTRVIQTTVCSAVGVHAGPGVVGIVFVEES